MSFDVRHPPQSPTSSLPNIALYFHNLQLDLVSISIPPWLQGVIPAALVLLSIFIDLATAIPYPAPLQAFFSWLAAPFTGFLQLDDLLDPIDRTIRTSARTQRVLLALSSVQVLVWVGCLAFALSTNDHSYLIKAVLLVVSWGYVAIRISWRPPLTPPYLFIFFALTQSFLALVSLCHDLISSNVALSAVLDVIAICGPAAFAWVAGTLPIKLYRPALNVAAPGDTPSAHQSMPEDTVNLWHWCSFSFLQPMLDLAMKRTLDENDVWSLSPYFLHKNLFTKCLDYRQRHPTHSLLRFLLVSNSLDLIVSLALDTWGAVVGFVPPYAFRQILKALDSTDPDAKSRAYFWTFITFLAHLSFAQVDLFELWHIRRCYERTRGQMFCTLHYKALKRQEVSGRVNAPGEVKNADLGKIVNLMQSDAYVVAQRFWDFTPFLLAPLRIVIAMAFLYSILGWSSFAGVVIVLVTLTLNYPLGQYDAKVSRARAAATDARMNSVNELLQNIRFLKFYGWEYTWSRRTEEDRETELKCRVKQNIVTVVISFIWIWLPSSTALVCFLCYTLIAGEQLNLDKAFTSIMLLAQLQGPMLQFPSQIFALIGAYVSMQRIEAFLQEPEVPDWASTLTTPAGNAAEDDGDAGFENASFEWEEKTDAEAQDARFRLGPLNLIFPTGKLTIVSGATGSGKSALLAALLGEMHCLSGRVKLNKANHRVAYCAQNPWLEHATIKDNIVFGSPTPFDEERYEAVLDACALRQDLAILTAGDMTEIGEKGITLSGGQRARVALARAMYSQAKCILMDDPLAAVDMHTAQHLVSHCLAGELARGRTIILVTHHITLCLPVASYLLELDKGAVLHQGTIPELADKGVLFNVIADEDEHMDDDDLLPVDNEADVSPSRPKRPTLGTPRPSTFGDGKLIDAEHRAEGRVSLHTYLTYIRSAGLFAWLSIFFLQLLIRLVAVASQLFLTRWSESYKASKPHPLLFEAVRKLSDPWGWLPPPAENVKPWLEVYLVFSAVNAFSVLTFIAVGYYASIQGSRSLFLSLLRRLTRAPARFFDTTPVGRILNRFTSDIGTIDSSLQAATSSCLGGVLNFLVSFGTILWIIPSFAPFALFISALYIRLAPKYIQASRDLRRLESVSLSPAFAGFDELLRGIVHIRAFGMESRYQDRFYQRVDKFQSFDHVYWLVSGWLMWRYDCLGSVIVFSATAFALWRNIPASLAVIVIVQAGLFADASRQLVKVAAQLELDFNAVERVLEYLDVPQEAPGVIEKRRPPAYWPSNEGSLVVEGLVVQYAPHLPAVLHGLTFTVRPCEKIGVVGRTGSGKSTLAMSLLRIIEPVSGSIKIDNIDIGTLGLEDLRTRVTIVSQDVSLFSGTIRTNLDPLGTSTDQDCLDVLERCHLTGLLNHRASTEEPTVLDMKINRESLSAGEKQLLALARALLRGTNVIIMDEATSQIDSKLDDKIQETIRTELKGAIVITIAHRLKTVMDYDRILVLDEGHIVEFDAPLPLMRRPGGAFRDMCRKSSDWPLLAHVAGEKSRVPSMADLSSLTHR